MVTPWPERLAPALVEAGTGLVTPRRRSRAAEPATFSTRLTELSLDGLLRPVGAAHHAVAVLGLGASDGDDVEPVLARLEGAHDLGCHAHHIPLANLTHRVVEQHAA